MRYLSLFSGVEAASLAWSRPWSDLGWTPVAFSEIDPFASALLAQRFPEVPNLGDVTLITEDQIEALGHIDVVVGGFPCQDLSVAGQRRGLKDEDGEKTRSGLFYDAVELSRWTGARWILLENVPGLFSSNGGGDFAAVLSELSGLDVETPKGGWQSSGVVHTTLPGYWQVAWSVDDAQFAGVPQRRRRVFIVGHLGDEWTPPAKVLFESKSLRGNPPTRRKTGAGSAPSSAGSPRSGGAVAAITRHGVGAAGADDNQAQAGHLVPDVVPAVSAKWSKGSGGPSGDECQNLVTHRLQAHGQYEQDDSASALKARDYKSATDLVTYQVGPSWGEETEVSPTVDSRAGDGPRRNQGGVIVASETGRGWWSEGVGALRSHGGGGDPKQVVAECVTGDVAHTLRADGFDASEDGTGRGQPIVVCQNGSDVQVSDTPGTVTAGQAKQTSGDVIAFYHNNRQPELGNYDDLSPTVKAGGNGTNQPAVAFNWQAGGGGNDTSFRGKSRQYIVRAGDYAGSLGNTRHDAVAYQCHGDNVGEMGTVRAGNGAVTGGVPFVATPESGDARTVSLRGREGGGTAELGDDIATALRASQGGGDKPHVLVPTGYTIHGKDGTTMVASETETASALRSRVPGCVENSTTTVVDQPIAFTSKDHGADAGDLSPTLRAMTHSDSHANGGGQVAVAFAENQRGDVYETDVTNSVSGLGGKPGQGYQAVRIPVDLQNTRLGQELAGTLDTTRPSRGGGQALLETVAFQERGRDGGRSCEHQEELAYALTAPNGGGRHQELNVATPQMVVRRLTPMETERLQGMPDNWTLVTIKGKPAADGPRYKSVGNSFAVPCVKRIGFAIQRVDDELRLTS